MTKWNLMAGAALIALMAGAAGAQADQRGPGPMHGAGFGGPQLDFGKADADGDGKVTKEEMQAYASSRFSEADTDGDGSLSKDEIVARMKAREEERREARRQAVAERMLERADDNKDGKLSLEEMMPPERTQMRMFERLDTDGDGSISQDELAQMRGWRGRGDDDHHHGGMWRDRDGDEGHGRMWRDRDHDHADMWRHHRSDND